MEEARSEGPRSARRALKARPRRRWPAVLLSCGCLLPVVGLLALLVAIHVPWIQRAAFERLAVPALREATGLDVSAETVAWNLLRASVDLGGLEVRSTADGKPVLKASRVHLGLPLSSLFRTWVFQVEMDQPELWLQQDAKGLWNVPPLNAPKSKEAPAPAPSGPLELPDYEVRTLIVRGLKIHFHGAGLGVDTEPIDLTANAALAALKGSATLRLSGAAIQVGGRRFAVESLSVDADSVGDGLAARIHGTAPGFELDSTLGLASVRRLQGLDGTLTLKVDGDRLAPGVLPEPLSPHVTLQAALRDDVVEIRELSATDGPSNVLAHGRITPGPIMDLELQARVPKLERYAPFLGKDLAGVLAFRGQLRGPLARVDGDLTLDVLDGTYEGQPLRGRGRVELRSGVLSFEGLQMQAAGVSARLSGSANAARLLEGAKEADGRLLVEGLLVGGADLGDVPLSFKVAPQQVQVSAELFASRLAVEAALDLTSGALQATARGSVPLPVLAPLAGLQDLRGLLELDLRVGGTSARPAPAGSLLLRELALDDTLRADTVKVEVSTGDEPGGPRITARTTAEGLVVAGRPLGHSEVELQAEPPLGQTLQASASLLGGQAGLQARLQGRSLAGTLELRDLDLGPWMAAAATPQRPTSGSISARLEFEAAEPTLQALKATLRVDKLHGQVGPDAFVLSSPPAIATLVPGGKLSTEHVELDLGQGDRLLLQGTADLLTLQGRGTLDLTLDLAKVAALLQQPIGGRLLAQADLSERGAAGHASIEGLLVQGQSLGGSTVTFEAVPPFGERLSAGATLLGGQVVANVELQDGGVKGSIDLSQLDLAPWMAFALPQGMPSRGSLSGRVEVTAAKPDIESLRATLQIEELAGRAGKLDFALARPGGARLEKGRVELGPLRLDLAQSGQIQVRASGTLKPLAVRFDTDGAVDLKPLGPLAGAAGAEGRVELAAGGEILGPAEAEGPIRFAGDGAHLSLRLRDVSLGPWIQALKLAPEVQKPAGLLSAQLSVQATGLRPEDVRAELKVPRIEIKLDQLQASSARPIAASFDGAALRVDSFELGLGGGDRIAVSGSVEPAAGRLDVAADGRFDLRRISSFAGTPIAGKVQANLRAKGPWSVPELSATIEASGLEAAGSSVGSLHVQLDTSGTGVLPPLPLPVPKGVIEARDLKAKDFAATSLRLELKPDTRQEGRAGLGGQARLAGMRYKDAEMGDLSAELGLDPEAATLQTTGLRGQLELHARWPLAAGQDGSVELTLRSLDLAPFLELAGIPFNVPPTGRLSASGGFRVPQADPTKSEGGIDVTELKLGLDDADLGLEKPARIDLREGELGLGPMTIVAVTAEVGAEHAALTLKGRVGAARLDLQAHGALPLGVVRPFVPGFESMQGTAQIEMAVGGKPLEPTLQGTITLARGRLVYAQPRIEIENVEARVDASGSRIEVTSAKAQIGEGLVSAKGSILLGAKGEMTADLGIQALGARLDMSDFDIDTRVDADLSYKGPIATGLLKGQVHLSSTRYTPRLGPLDILNRLTTRVRVIEPLTIDPSLLAGGEEAPVIGPEPQLNLAVTAASGSIEVESATVKATARAELQIVGKPSVPGVLGTVEVEDGMLNLYASKFEALKGTIDFERDPFALNPKLDLSASTEKSGETITLSIGGRALSPVLELTSSSGRPQTEVVRSLVGGSGSSGATAQQQISNLATAEAASFASQQLSSAVGLDIELVPPPVGAVPLLFAVSKQISERLFFKFYRVDSSTASDIYEFRYDATDQLSLEGRRTEVQSNALRIRFRKRFD
jgi:autotransporter translocation and assembly factor TamB